MKFNLLSLLEHDFKCFLDIGDMIKLSIFNDIVQK